MSADGRRLENLSEADLQVRLARIDRNIQLLEEASGPRDELPPERGWLSPRFWFRLRHWVLEEMKLRGVDPSAPLDIQPMPAMAPSLRLPSCLTGLLSPRRRDASGHLDLCSEMCGGATPAHLAEVAARLGIPAKLTCRPNLVSQRMQQGKWSAVRSVVEGDVLTTTALLMRWRHLSGGTVSVLEATRRLTGFVAEHCTHRPYAADWQRYADDLLAASFAAEARKLETLGASACN